MSLPVFVIEFGSRSVWASFSRPVNLRKLKIVKNSDDYAILLTFDTENSN